MNIMIIRNTIGNNLKGTISNMKELRFLALLILLVACSSKNPDKTEVPVTDIQKSESSQIASSTQVEEQIDQTEELYDEIKDHFSGSWKYSHASPIDGEREVSWGSSLFPISHILLLIFRMIIELSYVELQKVERKDSIATSVKSLKSKRKILEFTDLLTKIQ